MSYSACLTEKFKTEKEELKNDSIKDDTRDLQHHVVHSLIKKSCFSKDQDIDRRSGILIHPWNQIPLIKLVSFSGKPCEHEVQCVVRQPINQPLPSITFLRHDVSKYDQHMINRSSFHGCEKCFSVDNENYGCGDCTWLKWWFK